MCTKFSVDGQRQIGTLDCELSTMWEKQTRAKPQKASHLLTWPEQVTRPTSLL